MSAHEIKDKDGTFYSIAPGPGPKWRDPSSLAQCSISADQLLGNCESNQLHQAMTAMTDHLARRALEAQPNSLPRFSNSGVRLLSLCPQQALANGLANGDLVIHKHGQSEPPQTKVDSQALLKVKISQALKQIIVLEQQEKHRVEALLRHEHKQAEAFIHTGAILDDAGQAPWGLTVWCANRRDSNNSIMRCWRKYQTGHDLNHDNSSLVAEKRTLIERMRFDPSTTTTQQFDIAITAADTVWADPALSAHIHQFGQNYIASQVNADTSNTAELTVAAAFELLLTLILSAVATNNLPNSGFGTQIRLQNTFKKVGQSLLAFVEQSQRLKQQHNSRGAKSHKSASFEDFESTEALVVKAPRSPTTAAPAEPVNGAAEDDHSAPESETGTTDTALESPNIGGCSRQGEPISMVTGEELLELNDFVFNGPLPLTWQRVYRSSNGMQHGLGIGWTHPACEQLHISGDKATFIDAEGRNIPLALPLQGQVCENKTEQLKLAAIDDSFVLSEAEKPHRVFRQSAPTQLSALIDNSGNRLDFHYHDNRELSRIVSSWGPALAFHWQRGCINQIDRVATDGSITVQAQYEYNHELDLVACKDGNGNGERYAYRNHVIVQRTLKTGFNFYFEWDQYNPLARCTRQYGDNGYYNYRFEWDIDNRISRAIDSRDGVREFHYNARGQVTQEIDPEGGIIRSRFNDLGRLIQKIEPCGAEHNYQYSDTGQLLAYRAPAGGGHSIEYAAGRPVKITDALGNTETRQYNAQGLLSQKTDAAGASTHYQYNAMGLLSETISPSGAIEARSYDSQGRLSVKSNAALSCHYQYNSLNQLITSTEYLRGGSQGRSTRYSYDGNGNYASIHYPDGGQHLLEYNQNDELVSHTNGLGQTTRYQYDGLAQVRKKTDAAGHSFHYEYDQERNLTALINEKGERHQLEYDLNERLTEEVGFDGRVQQYRYNASGYLIGHIEGRHENEAAEQQHLTRYQRDASGKLLQKCSPDGEDSRFTYNAAGQLTAATNGHSQVAIAYNAAGLPIKEIQGQAELSHRYDSDGNRIETRLPSGQCIQFDFSHSNNQHWQSIALDGRILVAVERDAKGREISRQQGATASQFDYDPVGRLQKHRATNQSQKHSVVQRDYHYDAAGNLSQIADAGKGETHYRYDAVNQLQSSSGFVKEQFNFDAAGNLLANDAGNSQPAISGNRTDSLDAQRFEYDSRGNLTKTYSASSQTLEVRYHYNSQNQLVAVARTDRNGIEHRCRYQYDALGRRISKTDASGKTEFLWNGDVLLSETKTGKGVATEKLYLYEPNSFRPLLQIQDGRVYHYQLDHLGTPQELTDEHGQVVWSARYCAYGDIASRPVAQIDNNLRFQGQYFDIESGLHYNRHRYYSPKLGKFISQDPLGLAGGMNGYRYGANPTGWVDPLGLLCEEGQKRLKEMLNKFIDAHVLHPSDAERIFNNAVNSADPDDPNAYLKFQIPGGKNQTTYEYSVTGIDLETGTIIFSRISGDMVVSKTLREEAFVGGHVFDGKRVNNDWVDEGAIHTEETPLIKAKKVEGSEGSYTLSEEQKEILQVHCTARDNAITARNNANCIDDHNKEIPNINRASENIGEVSADMYITDTYKGFSLIHPERENLGGGEVMGSGSFDMVYQNEATGEVIIVEAKGGSSTLGKKKIGDKYYQQGTPEYADAITTNMKLNSNDNASTDRAAARAIINTNRRGKVKYLHIETPISTDSKTTIVKASEFKSN